MKRILFALAFVCALSASAFSQSTVVSGTAVLDNTGAPLASGQWCFGSTCFTVTSGAFSGSVTSGTQTVTVTNGSSTTYLTIPNVSIAGSYYNWNTFVVPSTGNISGIGAPRIACTPGALYSQTDGAQNKWQCISQNGAGVWNGLPNPGTPWTVTVGGTTTLSPGSPATVVNTGSENAVVLQFGIPQGIAGNTIWNGTTTPSSGTGANGDFYLDTATNCLYGPKVGGAWPGTCTSLVGPTGPTGPTGPPGTNTIEVNGSALSTVNFNGSTPAAPSGDTNCVWQVSGSSVSCYVPNGTPGGSNTEVQVNSSGVFGGSPNFTWVSNLLTLSGGISLSDTGGNGNFLMNGLTAITPTAGFGTISGDTVIGNGGTGGSLGNYTGLIYSTTSTFSSGVSSITVASAGTPIIGQGLVTNAAIVGPGIQAGTTISSFSGTTVNLSLPTNAPETGATIQVGPASTSGLILIGNDAGPNIVAGTGIVGIGQNVLQHCVTSGQDGEDNNSVVVGPDAAQNETCEETPQPSGALYGSTYQYTFEDVILGIKSDESGNANASSQFIGNHIQIPTYSQLTTLIGGNLGQQFGSPSNSFTNFYLTVGIGGNLFGSAPSANNTLYSAGYDVFIAPGGLGCFYNTSFLTIVGAALGYDGASACSTLSTATNSVLVASPGSNTTDINHIAANWTAGSGDVMVVAKGNGGFYGGGVTTGSYDSIFGPGAGAAVATGSYDSLFGEDAAPHYAGTALVSIGAQSFYSHTGTTSQGWNNTCAGYQCFYNEVSGANLTGLGNSVGLNETASADTLGGALTGDRSVASAGSLTGFGYEELYDTSNANAADQFLAFLGGSSDCTNASGCTYGISLGWSANITAATHATQIDSGTNATSNTVQYRSWNLLDSSGNIHSNLLLQSSAASSLASASTIAPTAAITDVTGSTTINNITVPSVVVNGATVTGMCLRLINAGTWSLGTSGNIAAAFTPAANQMVDVCYNSTDLKWYPSGVNVTPVRGTATLSSGTATVTNAAACAAGSSCIYKLSNCGPNSSTAIGVPSLGTVTAGTSFVINSLSATNTVVTGDASTVCWQIN